MLKKIVALLCCLPLMGFSFLTGFDEEFDTSARIIISSEDLVGSKLTIGSKSIEISSEDIVHHNSSILDIVVVRVSVGSHLVSLSKSDQKLLKTRVTLDIGQTRKLRVRQ